MRVLFIGGTGNISMASTRLALERGIELWHLNRGRQAVPGVHSVVADIRKPAEAAAALRDARFDAVVNWVAFDAADIERDVELFAGRTDQYIFISSASAYQKPPSHPVITESTPLANPYWDYSRKKIAAEERLLQLWRERDFPATIVRPSLTYDTVIPLAVGGWTDYRIIERMRRGLPVVVPGDGTSLWTITHADDFAKGLVGLLGHQQAIGHAFHITSDEILTWDQIYQATAAAAGGVANIVHIPSDVIADICDGLGQPWMRGSLLGDKSHSVIFDNTKIKRFVPGFCCTIPYARGIRRTIEWFEADPARRRIPDGPDVVQQILDRWKGTTAGHG